MNKQSEPILLCDHSCIDNKTPDGKATWEAQETQKALDLCKEMQEKISNEQCHLVDLSPEHRTPRDAVKSVKLVEPGAGETWWTQNYVGIFQLGEDRVVITSRFDQADKQKNDHPIKPFFLYYLLETCWDASIFAQTELGSAYDQNMFDVLLVVKLAVQLQKAWKKGTLRQYRTFEYNDSRVRGPIDIPRHIRENMGQETGRIAYHTRAYHMDNPYNVLFLQAVDATKRKYPDLIRRLCRSLPEFQAALRTLPFEAPDWAGVRRETVLRHTEKKIANPVYRDYEPARIVARAILQQLGADPMEKSRHGSAVTGVFVDMDRLWELFLEKKLFHGTGFAVQQYKSILNEHIRIEPDFLWEKKSVVLDAKNRPVWGKSLEKDSWPEDVRDDIYQVLSYMLALDCQHGGVVFPDQQHGHEDIKSSQVSPLCKRRFWRIPVNIPKAETYSGFVHQLETEIANLKKHLKEKEKDIGKAIWDETCSP